MSDGAEETLVARSKLLTKHYGQGKAQKQTIVFGIEDLCISKIKVGLFLPLPGWLTGESWCHPLAVGQKHARRKPNNAFMAPPVVASTRCNQKQLRPLASINLDPPPRPASWLRQICPALASRYTPSCY